MHPDVLTMVLAGGRGTRLEPLTRDRAKPAVPFGGVYRIIDFSLSNCINSGLRRILVLTQYKGGSLSRHIDQGWRFLSRELNEYIDVLPPQQRIAENWYQGTADAIYQNIYNIERIDPKLVLVLAGDHIYKMNYARMIEAHRERDADMTVGCLPVPMKDSRSFGVLEVDAAGEVMAFREKPETAEPMPGSTDQVLGSMGIYVFKIRVLFDMLFEDAANTRSSNHDFGRDIIPAMLGRYRVSTYAFEDENRKAAAYWRDVGTIDAFYQANMDLISFDPVLNLYDRDWPIHTYQPPDPPPKFVHSDPHRMGVALNSMICQGCIVSGGRVTGSILSPRVRVNSYASVEDSILFDGVQVGRHTHLRKVIVDKHVQIPEGFTLGVNEQRDRDRGFAVSDEGVVIVPKDSDLGLVPPY